MTRDDVQRLIEEAWAVLPIPRGEKGPRGESGWQKKAAAHGYAADDFEEGGNVGVMPGKPSGDRVDVDLDAPEAVAAGQLLLPQTDLVHGRAGKQSSHWWFLCPNARKREYKDPIATEGATLLEIRANSPIQTVVPPSIHTSGEPIEWERRGDPMPIAVDALEAAAAHVAIAALLARYWPERGARHSIALALGGFLGRYLDDPIVVEQIVRAAATIAGDDEVESRVRATRDTLDKLTGDAKVTGAPTFRSVFPNGEKIAARILEWLGAEGADLIDRINEHHFVIRLGGKSRREAVVGNDAEFPPSFESVTSFGNFNANLGTIKKQPAAKVWLTSPRRRTVDGDLVFAPPPVACRAQDYNLYRGFAVDPDPDPYPESRCARYLAHVRDVVCAGEDPDVAEFLLDVLAAKVQRPGELTEVAVVLRGIQGCGKGTFVEPYLALFGRHGATVDKGHLVTGKFNAVLSSKLVLNMDEAMWPGNKEFVGALKSLVTNRTLMIERKGIDAAPEPNYVQLFVTTNNGWAWPFELSDRRALVLDVSDARKGDRRYFDSVHAEVRDPRGLAALLAFLQRRRVTHDLRSIPRTRAALDQLLRSRDPVLTWWYRKLHDGDTWPEFGGWEPFISSKDAYDDYVAHCHGAKERPLAVNDFVEEWKRLLPPEALPPPGKVSVERYVFDLDLRRKARERGDTLATDRKQKRRGVVVPGLDTCRRYFAEHVAKTRVTWTGSAAAEQPEFPTFDADGASRTLREQIRQEVLASFLGRSLEDTRAELAAMFEQQRAARRASRS